MQRILDIGLFYICLSQWLFGNDKLNIRQRSWSVADLTRAITEAIEIKESNQISSDQIRLKVVEFSEISYSFSTGYSGSHNNWNNNFNSYSRYRFNYGMRSAEANPEAEANSDHLRYIYNCLHLIYHH